MTPEDLMDAIGDCDDRHIAQAGECKKRPRWHQAVAACLVLMMGLGLVMQMGGNAGSGNSGDLEYMYYTGPILPMTVREEADITAVRHTELDFSPYVPVQEQDAEYARWDSAVIATDTYTLTNEGAQSQTVTMLYPVTYILSESLENPPQVFVDGEPASLTQYAGSALGLESGRWESFKDYESLFSAGNYVATAFDEVPELGQEVIVYRLSELQGRIALEYQIDRKKSLVCDYGASGGSYGQDGVNHLEFDQWTDDPEYYLVVFGEDLQDYTVQGECTVRREVMTLEEILGILTERALASAEQVWERPMPDRELCLGLLAEYLEHFGMLQAPEGKYYSIYSLSEILSVLLGQQYLFYWAFDVSLPAGEAVTVEAVTYREAHTDYTGKKQGRDGYDLATTLGSNLTFTKQTVSVTNFGEVELVEDNFGFRWNRGITTVELDLEKQHYWLQVRKKS